MGKEQSELARPCRREPRTFTLVIGAQSQSVKATARRHFSFSIEPLAISCGKAGTEPGLPVLTAGEEVIASATLGPKRTPNLRG